MNPPEQPPANNDIIKTDIVENIPMRAPSPEPTHSSPVKIRSDLGQTSSQAISKPKHHLFSKKSKPGQAAFAAQPVERVSPPPTPALPTQPAAPTQPNSKAKPKPARTADKKSVPVFIILVTLIVTSALIVVAMAAYKQK